MCLPSAHQIRASLTHVDGTLAGLALQPRLEALVEIVQDLGTPKVALGEVCARDDTEAISHWPEHGLRGEHDDGFLDHAARDVRAALQEVGRGDLAVASGVSCASERSECARQSGRGRGTGHGAAPRRAAEQAWCPAPLACAARWYSRDTEDRAAHRDVSDGVAPGPGVERAVLVSAVSGRRPCGVLL